MTTLTIDKIDERMESQLGEQAQQFGITKTELARRILRDYLFAAPMDDAKNDDAALAKKRAQVASLCGVWSKKEFDEFTAATADFSVVDPQDWQ